MVMKIILKKTMKVEDIEKERTHSLTTINIWEWILDILFEMRTKWAQNHLDMPENMQSRKRICAFKLKR